MKFLILCLVLVAVIAQDFYSNPRKSSSELVFESTYDLLSYMHVKQERMKDRYISSIGTVYAFYNDVPKSRDSQRQIEQWRVQLQNLVKEMQSYFDIEEIIVDDSDYDELLNTYNTSRAGIQNMPLVLIDEFDERVWVYNLNQIEKIKSRLKLVLSDGIIANA